ncbi:MAG: hypothetical protein ACOC3V_03960 [bacterium]
MKIAINGDIIDTKHIYKISKLETINFAYPKNYGSHYCCSFRIQSFNRKTIVVENVYDFTGYQNQDDFYRVVKNTEKKLSDFRDKIINIWLQNQSEIPQFNLD